MSAPRLVQKLPIETPWSKPAKADCHFYHAMDLPGGETIPGTEWDLRGRFDAYVGGVQLAGKRVLDVGTASGFLAFHAEKAGATVTAVDCRDALDRDTIPFAGAARLDDPDSWHVAANAELVRLKNSFWYAWHSLGSQVQVAYLPMRELALIEERFDVVIAGALIEHLADPVQSIGAFCRAARETVVLPFTQVARSGAMRMRAMNPWRLPPVDYAWWTLSRGLFEAVFANCGFTIELKPCTARWVIGGEVRELTRKTIIARRVSDRPLARPKRMLEWLRR